MSVWRPRKSRHTDGNGSHANGCSNDLHGGDQTGDNDVFAFALGHEGKPEGSAPQGIDFRKGSNVGIRHAYRIDKKNAHVLSRILTPPSAAGMVEHMTKFATEWCDEGKLLVHHILNQNLPGPLFPAVSGGKPSIPRGDARGAQKCGALARFAGRAAASRLFFATIASSRHQFSDWANP